MTTTAAPPLVPASPAPALPLFVIETFDEACARVPALEAVSADNSPAAFLKGLALLDSLPGYVLMQYLPPESFSGKDSHFLFRRVAA